MRLLPVLGLLSVLIPGTAVPAAATSAPLSSDATVQAYVDAFATPGIAAAVVSDGGVELIVRGRDGDGRTITPHTLFRIASMSKSMTATAVMLLVQDRKIALDDRVIDTLPEFTMADERYEEVTIRQLLSHTSGLSLRTNPEFALPAPRTTEAVVAELRDRRLVAEPGARFEYHNTNYSIAARVVEVVSGESLDDFLRQRLFVPLGMLDTQSVDACDQAVERLAPGFSVVLGLAYVMPEMPGRCGGNGGVVSTLADMVRWLRFQQGEVGAGVLDRILLEELHVSQPGAESYALGWQRAAPGGGDAPGFVSHGGTLATFTGSMAFAPETGRAAVVLTNGVGSPGELVQNLIVGADGVAAKPYENPLNIVNGILSALAVLALILLLVTALRAPRWAARRRAARRPRSWLRLIPLTLVIVVGLFVPLAPALLGGSVEWQYWVFDLWLFPLLDVLGIVLVLGGISALVSRIVALRVVPVALRGRLRASRQSSTPV
ncbi:serine hydrolase [Microbacterium maritypicum]|uniref:serine hydrolase domain-containing protein n=1 Tax=Microbacterium TaxID=33882 RepID=UPI001AB05F72|nr:MULTISPECIES: serine hydrolase domain-containing protein [Microbacterium]